MAAVTAARPATPILLGGLGVPQRLIDSGVPYLANVEWLVAEVERLAIREAVAAPSPGDAHADGLGVRALGLCRRGPTPVKTRCSTWPSTWASWSESRPA